MRAVDAGGGDRRGVGGSDGRQRWMADTDGMAEGKAEKRGGWRWRRRREWRRGWRRRGREAAAAATAARAAVPKASASLLRVLSARPAPCSCRGTACTLCVEV